MHHIGKLPVKPMSDLRRLYPKHIDKAAVVNLEIEDEKQGGHNNEAWQNHDTQGQSRWCYAAVVESSRHSPSATRLRGLYPGGMNAGSAYAAGRRFPQFACLE